MAAESKASGGYFMEREYLLGFTVRHKIKHLNITAL